MSKNEIAFAKEKLDTLISKQRVHMYKPIQIAEILYYARQGKLTQDELKNRLEAYRNPSKRWRDSVTRLLLDQVSTSSQKYQDNLFEANAIPPAILAILAQENEYGIVERYIYQKFRQKQDRILKISHLLEKSTVADFNLKNLSGIHKAQYR